MSVDVVHWNPRLPVVGGKTGRWLPGRRRPNNFGDLLGPIIVAEIVKRRRLKELVDGRRLLAVGSIVRLAHDGDVLWGVGANGKSLHLGLSAQSLDVRAVRGPLTREYLMSKGFSVPAVYGDPGLLIGQLWERAAFARGQEVRDVTVVPNLNDLRSWKGRAGIVDPRSSLPGILSAIAASRFVVGSSLHAIVIAESFGIPARLVRSGVEPEFKYRDYYLGTGRAGLSMASTIDEAIEMGGEPLPNWSSDALLQAFPEDLWVRSAS